MSREKKKMLVTKRLFLQGRQMSGLCGKELNKRQISGLVQIKSICRRQNKCDSKTEIYSRKGIKYCGKQLFLLFPHCFQKAIFSGLGL